MPSEIILGLKCTAVNASIDLTWGAIYAHWTDPRAWTRGMSVAQRGVAKMWVNFWREKPRHNKNRCPL